MRQTVFFLLLFPFCLYFGSCSPTESPNLNIATAANASYAITEIQKEFTAKTGIPTDIIIGSSGKLTAQIKEGAPYDIFISADMKYPNTLFENGMAVKEPAVYAKGQLVLWSFNTSIPPYLDSLSNQQIRKIAIPNPKTAPYGKAAFEALNKNNLLEKIESKFVYGESISQTNQFITSKTVDIGFTSKSVVLAPQFSEFSKKTTSKGNWTLVNPKNHSPILQGVIVVKRNQAPDKLEQAKQFYAFLFSEQGKQILRKYGYN